MLDLSFLSNKDVSHPLEILHTDTKKPIGVTFHILPETSAAVFEAVAGYREKAFDAQLSAMSSAKEEEESSSSNAEMVRETVAARYAAMVEGWESKNPEWDKKIGPYSKEKAMEIFMAARLNKSAASILEQVSEFASKVENFTEAPKTT